MKNFLMHIIFKLSMTSIHWEIVIWNDLKGISFGNHQSAAGQMSTNKQMCTVMNNVLFIHLRRMN